MKLPFVIDNRDLTLSEVLNELLVKFENRSLDVATAYFTVSGFDLLKDGLKHIGSFRLLLGAQPQEGSDLGLRSYDQSVALSFNDHLQRLPFNAKTLTLIEELIAFLQQTSVNVRVIKKGFLHAKCFLIYGDKPDGQAFLFDRFQPLIGIVGSSNFTGPGLTSNQELNLSHRVLLSADEAIDEGAGNMVQFLSDEKPTPRITEKNRQLVKSEVGARAISELVSWYDTAWAESRDFKQDLIELLNASKFGQKEYTPYQVYIKALYEYFKDEFHADHSNETVASAVDLAEFQDDAVKKARKILAIYNGVLIADSVGLGKTWIGKKLLEDHAYHRRQKALVICPASLRDLWKNELLHASISAAIESQEALGQPSFSADEYGDADVILIDESHNFRNSTSQRYENLEAIVGRNGGCGRCGERKKILLLTATPINNDILDLYNQINLVTQGDDSYFSAIGIGDLRKYFLKARRERTDRDTTIAIFNLLEEFVVRRTRPFIKKAYPEATIRGRVIKFPERKLKTVRYDLESAYQGIYQNVVGAIENLRLAPYHLESYKKEGVEIDVFEQGRQVALVGIFKSRFLKRLESSIQAFRISIRRALQFQKTFESYLLDGKLLDSSNFRKAMRYLASEDTEDDATPASVAEQLDASEQAKLFLADLPLIDIQHYDLRHLHEALQKDIDALQKIWTEIKEIDPQNDTKLESLKSIISGELKHKKFIVFTYYKDTARYLEEELKGSRNEEWRDSIGNPILRRMDSGNHPHERTSLVQKFAPINNEKPEWKGTDEEIQILISTDVLSEGQNLQDCGYLLNYDLHWNPTRMVQRAGRIDRLGSDHELIWIYNMFPDAGLEQLLGIVERLSRKISDIDRTGFLDASVLGEQVNPKNFGTLRKISDEDDSVIEEEENFIELASNEFLLQQIGDLIRKKGEAEIKELPDGIHSGLARQGSSGMFFYFQAENPQNTERTLHFWKYYDAVSDSIIDNRYLIANIISSQPDTPRIISDLDPFAIHDRIVEDIVRGYREQTALEVAPQRIEPIQQQLITALEGLFANPGFDRQFLMKVIEFVSTPKSKVQSKELKRILNILNDQEDYEEFIKELTKIMEVYGVKSQQRKGTDSVNLTRNDLRLICFDHISCG